MHFSSRHLMSNFKHRCPLFSVDACTQQMEFKKQFRAILTISVICTLIALFVMSNLLQLTWHPFLFKTQSNETFSNSSYTTDTTTRAATGLFKSTTEPNANTVTWTPTNAAEISSSTPTQKFSDNVRTFTINPYKLYHGGLIAMANKVDFAKCFHYKNCEIVRLPTKYDGSVAADVILMQGNHMPRVKPRRRDPNQVIVYWASESPQYLQLTNTDNPFFIDYFNWTMAYRIDSDIPYLYGLVLPRSMKTEDFMKQAEMTGNFGNISTYQNYVNQVVKDPLGIASKDYASIYRRKDATKCAVWLVSHCVTASKRERYVKQMEPYLDIDVFGKCTQSQGNCSKADQECNSRIVDSYKFYLAFENSLCTDYITEKAFKWFNEDIVLVVRGARKYKTYLPPNTYVDADDFESAEALANYLSALGSNEEQYLNFLKTKDMFRGVSGGETGQLAFCNLCYKLNNLEQYRQSISDIGGWWKRDICTHQQDVV